MPPTKNSPNSSKIPTNSYTPYIPYIPYIPNTPYHPLSPLYHSIMSHLHTQTALPVFPALGKLYWFRMKLIYTFQEPSILPKNKNTYFRGLLGHLLRAFQPEMYKEIFEFQMPESHPRARKYTLAPSPYILQVPDKKQQVYAKGDSLEMNLTLIGKAAEHYPDLTNLLYDWKGIGIGKQEANIQMDDFKVYQPGKIQVTGLLSPEDKQNGVESYPDSLRLHAELRLRSPMSLRSGGQFPDKLSLPLLIWHLAERMNLLGSTHCGADWCEDYSPWVQAAEQAIQTSAKLRVQKWERYSNRSKSKQGYPGWIGGISWQNIHPDLIPFLLAGAQLHVGKGSPWGMGRYQLDLCES